MRNRWLLLVVAVGAPAAALLATCEERRASPGVRSLSDARSASAAKSAERIRTESSGPEGEPDDDAVASTGPAPAPTPAATTEFEFAKRPPATARHTLRGRVMDAHRNPVGGARVVMTCTWMPDVVADHFVNWPPQAESSVLTAADGSFEVPYWEGGRRELAVGWSEDEHGQVTARRLIRGASDDRFHEIVLGVADLVVRTTADGKPVAPMRISVLSMPVYEVPAAYGFSIACAVDRCRETPGVVRFADVTAGRAVLEIVADGFAPVSRWIEIAESGETVIDVPLAVGVTLRGRLIDADTGTGLADGIVIAGYSTCLQAPCDADGRFEMHHVPLEPRNFQAFRADAGGYAPTTFLADGAGEETVVKLRRDATLLVRCIGERGAPAADAIVEAASDYDASPPYGMRSVWTGRTADRTGDDGRVELTDLHPGTEGLDLRVRFYLDGVPVLERTFPPLVPGETRDLGDVVLAPTLALRGAVLDADGNPAAGATVVAALNDATDEEHGAIGTAVIEQGGRRAEAGPDGAFTLMGLSPGLWDLYASTDDTTPGRLAIGVDPKSGAVTLRLPRIVALEGRVVDASGSPVAKARVTAAREEFGLRMLVSCTTNDDGRFRIPGFAADGPEVEVSVTAPGLPTAQTFKARPGGASAELRLR